MDFDSVVVVIARVVASSQVKKYHSIADSKAGESLAGASALVAVAVAVDPAVAFAGLENVVVEPYLVAAGKGNEEEGGAS